MVLTAVLLQELPVKPDGPIATSAGRLRVSAADVALLHDRAASAMKAVWPDGGRRAPAKAKEKVVLGEAVAAGTASGRRFIEREDDDEREGKGKGRGRKKDEEDEELAPLGFDDRDRSLRVGDRVDEGGYKEKRNRAKGQGPRLNEKMLKGTEAEPDKKPAASSSAQIEAPPPKAAPPVSGRGYATGTTDADMFADLFGVAKPNLTKKKAEEAKLKAAQEANEAARAKAEAERAQRAKEEAERRAAAEEARRAAAEAAAAAEAQAEKDEAARQKADEWARIEAHMADVDEPTEVDVASNKELQEEEQTVLESIYPNFDRASGKLTLGDGSDGECVVQFTLPPGYPSAHPPRCSFDGLPWDLEADDLERSLQVFFVDRFADAPGEVVLFDWLTELQPTLEEAGIEITT